MMLMNQKLKIIFQTPVNDSISCKAVAGSI